MSEERSQHGSPRWSSGGNPEQGEWPSNQHSELRNKIIGELRRDPVDVVAIVTALDDLVEQLEAANERLLQAEEFIAHMDMNYSYAEWLERATTNPASVPNSGGLASGAEVLGDTALEPPQSQTTDGYVPADSGKQP